MKGKIVFLLFVIFLSQIIFANATSFEEPYLRIHPESINFSVIEPYDENFSRQGIFISEDRNEIHIFYTSVDPYLYNRLTEEHEEVLIQACSPNITSVLNYIKVTGFEYDYNDFYTVHPSTFGGDYYEKVYQIDENWYLASHNLEFTPHPLIDNTAISFILLTIAAFAITSFFGYKYKKTKLKKILTGLIISVIISIILLNLTILWIWLNTQIMY